MSATGVRLANGSFIPAELVVWAAGVKAPDVLANLDGLESIGSNQLVITETLQTTEAKTQLNPALFTSVSKGCGVCLFDS